MRSAIDHIVVATSDLQDGIDYVEDLLGVASVRGGSHPDTVTWQLTFPKEPEQGFVMPVPFFIDWGNSAHPASRCEEGATLIQLGIQHPDPAEMQRLSDMLEFDAAIDLGARSTLTAQIKCPRGLVTLV